MVTVTVRRPFRDFSVHVMRRVGETFEATEARVAELDAKLPGYVSHDAPDEDKGLESMSLRELRELAAKRGMSLPKNASKAKAIEALEGRSDGPAR